MALYEIQHLTFTYPSHLTPTLTTISLSIKKGEFVIIVGSSGSGKSTLLRQLKKEILPHGKQSGSVLYNSTPLSDVPSHTSVSEIGMVFQNPENQILMQTVFEELAFGMENLGFSTFEIERRIAEITTFFGINHWLYKETSSLSGGQKQLLNVASVMMLHPKVLLLDEPTSQLDPLATKNFLHMLKELNDELSLTILMSEHRLEEVFPLADRVIVLDNGKLIGTYSPHEMIASIGKNPHHKLYPYLPSVSKLYLSLADKIEKSHIPLTPRSAKEWFDNAHFKLLTFTPKETTTTTAPLLTCQELYFQYEKNTPFILEDISLSIPKGSLVAILGGNGSGKSTLLKVLAGIYKPLKGKIKCTSTIGYLPQNPMLFFNQLTVRLQLESALPSHGVEGTLSITDITSFLQLEHLLDHHPYDLSGGEMQKVALAIILLKNPKILLLDEPTKGLDPHFKVKFGVLLQKLLEEGKTILMVSHDMSFVASHATFTTLMFGGRLLSLQPTNLFFANNNLYTTPINRTVKEKLPNAILLEDVLSHVSR